MAFMALNLIVFKITKAFLIFVLYGFGLLANFSQKRQISFQVKYKSIGLIWFLFDAILIFSLIFFQNIQLCS